MPRHRSFERYLGLIPLLAGGLSAALGAVVMIGWLTHQQALVQVHRSFVPMQFNTALGFLCFGVGLLLACGHRRHATRICGAVTSAIGWLTLVQYVGGVDLGIDQLFMEHYITVQTSHPGRMAPNTALCFALTGAALIVAAAPAPKRSLIVGLLGLGATALGATAFFGYVVGLETAYGWGRLTRMAVHTSAGFLGLGIGLQALAWRVGQADHQRQLKRWLPVHVGVTCVIITLVLWQAMLSQEQRHIEQTTAREAELLAHDIQEAVESHVASLEWVAQNRAHHDGPFAERWVQEAATHLRDRLGFGAIAWVGPDYRTRWTVGRAGGERAWNPNLASEPRRREALEQALNQRITSVTRPIDLGAGHRGLMIDVPVLVNDEPVGFIVGAVRFDTLLGPILEKEAAYSVTLAEGDEVFHVHEPTDGSSATDWLEETDVAIRNATWRLRVAPSEDKVAAISHFLPSTILIGGMVGSILLMMVVRFGQVARRASQSLLENEARLRLMEELATDGVWDRDLSTGEEYLSPQWKAMFGYEDHELANHADTWQSMIFPEDLELALRAYKEHTEEGKPFDIPVRYRHKDGTTVWVLCRGQALKDENGAFYRMVGTHTNITPLKRAEEALSGVNTRLEQEATERTADLHQSRLDLAQSILNLKRSNEELEQFAYAASHDLKTPLITFLGYLKQLGKQVEADNKEGVTDSIARMQRAADHMRELIDDLLELSRIGRVVSEPEPVDVGELAREFADDSAVLLAESRIDIRVEDSMPVIVADKVRIRQVLQNLLSNAIKYGRGDNGGSIHVGSQRVDGEARFFVRDEGPGIPAEYHDKIFGLFQKLEGSSKGTGVGLTIVRRAIEWHGGRVWVESESGRGTTFWLSLPKDRLASHAA